MKLNGAQITIKILESYGIERIYGIPGGANLPLYDALSESKIQHILARHEQGAGFMAQGEARSTGKPAVCFATSGPGATNLITAIADAKMDSVPIIAITGQIPTSLIGTDAFQEVDTYGITVPITKHNFLVKTAEELIRALHKAFKIAMDGRPGPVVIDIPKDIQLGQNEYEENEIFEYKNIAESKKYEITAEEADRFAAKINESKKPVIINGGGVISSDSSELIREIAEKNSIPVASTLMALGSFSPDSRLFLGMPGMHGSRFINHAIEKSDLIISLGSRFDDRLTGKSEKFCGNSEIIHIDIDKSELNKIKKASMSIRSDLKTALENIKDKIPANPRHQWMNEISQLRKTYPILATTEPLSPYSIISSICNTAPEDAVITTDVGQHQMWTAQYYKFNYPRQLLTSGGLGTMGFGMPSAIGAAFANPNKQIICFTGDGSFLMNNQELAVIKEYNLNIKIILFNNQSLGLVRQQQELFYKKNYYASQYISNPDFAMMANSFGIHSHSFEKIDCIKSVFSNVFNESGPVLLDIPIEQEYNVYPIVPPGKSNTEMIGGYYEKHSS